MSSDPDVLFKVYNRTQRKYVSGANNSKGVYLAKSGAKLAVRRLRALYPEDILDIHSFPLGLPVIEESFIGCSRELLEADVKSGMDATSIAIKYGLENYRIRMLCEKYAIDLSSV